MRNKSIKKWVSSLVLVCMLLSSFGVALGAPSSSGTDIKGHWAESEISAWLDKGFINGYENGSFKPEGKITRAEFIALINRSFGFTEEDKISFTDVSSDNWAYAEVAKAAKAGYITGYANGTIGANNPISRQEVAVIVSRLLKLQAVDNAGAESFLDANKFASWSKEAIGVVVGEKIMTGYDADDSFKPEASITRAEAVVTLDRAKTVQTGAAQSVSYDKAGSYGPVSGVETINKNVVVNTTGVTLRNMVINGNLLLGEGIGEGDAFLENVKVTGKVTIQGGGENSIHFNNSVLVDIIIDKKSGTGTVRIVSEGTTTVALVIVNSPVLIKETNSTGTGFGNINISSSLPAGSKVTLSGTFETVNVSAQQIQVDVPEGAIKKVNANSTSTGMSLNLSQDATINSLVLDAIVKLLGQGTIVAAVINTPGSTFEKPAVTTTTPIPTPTAPPTTSAPTTTPTVTKTALTTAIANATTLLEAHPVGEANGNVTQVTYDAYKSAIKAATAIKTAASSTQLQVNTAITTLAAASSVFTEAFVVVTTTALTTAIANATLLLGDHSVGAANGDVTQETYDAYMSAIQTATAIKTAASSTQLQVDTAITTLAAASSVFTEAFVVVTTTALTTAIANATTLLEAHLVGEDNADVAQATHNAYKSAIDAATEIIEAVSSTQLQVDTAITTLAEASSVFNGAIIIITPEATNAAIEDAKAALTDDSIRSENTSLLEVKTDLILSNAGLNRTTITWSSDNLAVSGSTGKITRPAFTNGDLIVNLTATITRKNGTPQTKVFTITIIKLDQTADEAIAAAISVLNNDTIRNLNADLTAVTTGLTLSTIGTDGTTIAWSSNNAAIDANTGAVTQPANTASNATVTLTATVTKAGGAPLTKTYIVIVKKLGKPAILTADDWYRTNYNINGTGTLLYIQVDGPDPSHTFVVDISVWNGAGNYVNGSQLLALLLTAVSTDGNNTSISTMADITLPANQFIITSKSKSENSSIKIAYNTSIYNNAAIGYTLTGLKKDQTAVGAN